MLFICLVLAWIFYDIEQMKIFFKMIKRTVFGVSNFFLYKNTGGYFDAPEDELPLLHTWSLSVEEQFYIFLPVLLWSMRNFTKKYTIWVILGITLSSAILSAYTITFNTKFSFYMLPARAYELLLGVLLTFVKPNKKISFAPQLHLCGLALILLCIVGFGYLPKEAFPGLWPLIPCLGTALCIYAGTSARNTVTFRVLSNKAMRGTGLVSYSLYLYHWPLLVFFRQTRLTPSAIRPVELFPVLAAIFVISCLSYFLWEQPVRKKYFLTSRRALFTTSFSFILIFFLIGHVGRKFITPYIPVGAESYLLEKNEWTFAQNNTTHIDDITVTLLGKENSPPSFLMLGDSHAAMLAEIVSELSSEHELAGYLMARGGNDPLILPSDDILCRRLIERESFEFALLSFRWALHLEQCDLGDFTDRPEVKERVRELSQKLTNSIEYMIQRGIRNIYIMEPFPAQTVYYPASRALGIIKRRQNPEEVLFTELEANMHYNRNGILMLENIAAKYPQVHLLNPVPYLCADGICPAVKNKRTLYVDDDHISLWGATLLKPVLQNIFQNMVN